MDRIYQEVPLDSIPWNSEIPPDALIELVQSDTIRPCRTIDLGCGAGNYAIYLSGLGFDVTGVDSAPTAIAIAREHAKNKHASCRFIVADLLGNVEEVPGMFNFAYDWEFLHHIFPEDREQYVRKVHKLLTPEAIYFSVCFSEKDPQFGGVGKFRKTRVGTTLYFSSESELEDLFSPFFSIRELKTIKIEGKTGAHCAISVLMDKR
ncbi:MAG: class I SAM-dependent methyltransferase [Methanoregula sp.]|nr:class I SAM-dependent methyltransferase [Methanoregula sp.]